MPQHQNQRILAAIIFTDVVGYSARVQIEEEKTIALVKRDLTAFEKLCAAGGGRVVKNTGDGLLMCFTSLDSALKTATGMLEYLDTGSRTFTPDKRLEHRLGIHLGDVIANGSDVLGDGVNIAARLMGEAQPDTICISYSAFEFIKNRTRLHSQFIGPRQLKNIKDPVTAVLLSYRPPLGVLVPAEPESAPIQPRKTAFSVPARILYIGAPIVAALVLLMFYFLSPSTPPNGQPLAERVEDPAPPPDTQPPAQTAAVTLHPPSAGPVAPPSPTPARAAIDALALINVDRDAVRGEWDRTPEGLRCQPAGMNEPFIVTDDSPSAARIALPLTPAQIPREYDFNVSFTRNSGQASIALIFVSGENTAVFEVDAWGRNLGGIQNVSGRNMQAYPDSTFTLRIVPGQRYDLSLRVRKQSIAMVVDGREMAVLPSDGSDLSLQFWAMKKENPLGVGAFRSGATFHSIQIVPVNQAPSAAR